MFSFLHSALMKCPHQESNPGCRKRRGFKPPSRHFFFFRLDLPARPALSVILPWLCMQGPVA